MSHQQPVKDLPGEANRSFRRSRIQSLAQLYQTGYSSKAVDATIAKLVDMERSRLQAEADNLAAQMQEFDTAHGMKSAEFHRQFHTGTLGDDADLFEWSAFYQMWLSLESKIQAIRR